MARNSTTAALDGYWRWHLGAAARAVLHGGVIAYPTEGVYGLGCDPLDGAAVGRLLVLKARSWRKGLIVIAADVEQIGTLVRLPDARREQIIASWPGPYTWILPAQPAVPRWLTGGRGTLAVRVTAHPLAGRLCVETGPLVSTSANPSGRPPARSALTVRRYFGEHLDAILPGATGGAAGPTAIYDGGTGRVVRPAAVGHQLFP